MAPTPKALHSKARVRGEAAYPGNAVRGDMVTPTGLDNHPTCMAVFTLHERLVRRIPRLYNPVGVWIPRGVV